MCWRTCEFLLPTPRPSGVSFDLYIRNWHQIWSLLSLSVLSLDVWVASYNYLMVTVSHNSSQVAKSQTVCFWLVQKKTQQKRISKTVTLSNVHPRSLTKFTRFSSFGAKRILHILHMSDFNKKPPQAPIPPNYATFLKVFTFIVSVITYMNN